MPRPGGHNNSDTKVKDFGKAVTRLLKELKPYKVLILISIILATTSSILAIFTPNILSDLTDCISEGLIPNKDNIMLIKDSLESDLNKETLKTKLPSILNLNLDQNTINNILSSNISNEDKSSFTKLLSDQENFLTNLSSLPDSVLDIIITDSNYEDTLITKEDKINLIKSLNTTPKISSSIANILFTELTIDNITITKEDKAEFLSLMGVMNENTTAKDIYQKIDESPTNIKNLIKPNMPLDKIKKIAYTLIALYIISAIFNYIEAISMTIVSNRFANRLRKDISHKINKLPLKYFDKTSNGDILSRITNDVDTLSSSMDQSLSTLVSAIALFIGTTIMMFLTNWIMSLTAIISSLIGFIFMFLILGKSQKYFSLRQKELGALNGHIEEVYSGLNVVKSYNGQKQVNEKFDKLNQKMYEANRKSRFLSSLMMPLMNFVGNFGYVAVCVAGALLTSKNIITFGVIVAFITYVRLFTSPLSQIAQSMTSLQTTAAASERVFEFLDEEELTDESHLTKVLKKKDIKGQIEFKNVTFTYADSDKPTIKDFSAIAKPGKKVAIVGPTGAGKTTMVNLLMKFYEINGGDILIDGTSIHDLTRENIHSLFTMVLQDTWLFEGTIKENIVYNRKNVTQKRVEEVCKTVGVDHFIKTLPHGYDTVLSDNESISAGQKQLLTIARGMIEDAPFLILDEATSNVDTRTEELVQKAMDKLTKGKTSFIIAHRLSTIKNADLILVMKDGNIVEQGTHEELIKLNGSYATLYNSQFEL